MSNKYLQCCYPLALNLLHHCPHQVGIEKAAIPQAKGMAQCPVDLKTFFQVKVNGVEVFRYNVQFNLRIAGGAGTDHGGVGHGTANPQVPVGTENGYAEFTAVAAFAVS